MVRDTTEDMMIEGIAKGVREYMEAKERRGRRSRFAEGTLASGGGIRSPPSTEGRVKVLTKGGWRGDETERMIVLMAEEVVVTLQVAFVGEIPQVAVAVDLQDRLVESVEAVFTGGHGSVPKSIVGQQCASFGHECGDSIEKLALVFGELL